MKKIKRFLGLALVVVMGVSTLSGCGTKKEIKEEVTSNSNGTQNEDELITIDWMAQNDQPVDEDSPVIAELEKKFNVKLNFIYMDRNKQKELLNIRISTGEIPDVMRFTDDVYRNYINQGVLAEIPEDLLKEKGSDIYEIGLKNGGDLAWEYPKQDGKLYGIPLLNSAGKYTFNNIWRDDWLKNVGIDKIPGTIEEAEEAFYKFVNEDPDQNGKKDTFALSNAGMSSIYGAFGGVPWFSKGGGNSFTWSVKDGQVMATATMPEMKDALTLLNKWYKDGLIDPEFITGENKGQYWGKSISFWNGRIGYSTPGLFYHVNEPYNDNDLGSTNYQGFMGIQAEKGGSYVVGKPIVGPNGDFGTERWGTYPGIVMAFGKQVQEDRAKMEKLIEMNNTLVSDFDAYVLSMFGREGKDYQISDGIYTSNLSSKEIGTFGLMNNGVGYICDNNFDFRERVNTAKWEYANEVGTYAENYENAVWAGLPSDPIYKESVLKMIQENYFLFIMGERDIAEFDNFIKEVNDAGLNELTKEANEWYNKFN